MTLLAAWILLPVVLGAASVGCALLLERALGIRLPTALLPGLGLAVVIVVGQVPGLWDATAELASPLVVALAVAGFALGWRREWRRGGAAALVATAVFAIYAAPIVLSGDATFAGYIKLDDTATWLALTDQVMTHGRDASALAPSTHEATVALNLADGYPVGIFVPLGIGHELLGQDSAWLIQPYMAYFGAILALALWSLAGGVIHPHGPRAVVAFLAAQPAILYGYYLWGGVKEIAAAALVATGAALTVALLHRIRAADEGRERSAVLHRRALIPLAFASAALVGTLGGGGAIWAVAAVVLFVTSISVAVGTVAALARAAEFAVLTTFLSLPVLATGGLQLSGSTVLTSESELGNLIAPLKVWQLSGIWPAGDFRLDPVDPPVAFALIVVAVGAAIWGLIVASRARAWGVIAYLTGALVACLAIVAVASPWIDGKALAIASPAIPFVACLAGAALLTSGRRVEGAVLLSVLAGGILWSTVLAYRDVSLAPRDQLLELEETGKLIAGQGPALMTEYQPYGARHFLRDGNAEGLSELRRRVVPLQDGEPAEPQSYHDLDEVDTPSLLFYPTLVLRRTPTLSRPPSPYERTFRGNYYEVWQRTILNTAVVDRLGLGNVVQPGAVPNCDELTRLAAKWGSDATLAATPAPTVVPVELADTDHPAAWASTDFPTGLEPKGAGAIRTQVEVPHAGEWTFWLGGSIRPKVDIEVDGREVGSVRHELNNSGQYVLLAETVLTSGLHDVAISFAGADLHPGSGGINPPVGPLVLSDSVEGDVTYVPARRAADLCGKPWDWVEVHLPATEMAPTQ